MRPRRRMMLLVSVFLLLVTVKLYFRAHHLEEPPLSTWFKPKAHHLEEPPLSTWFKPKKRSDVTTITDWLAPILWDGTFNAKPLEKFYRRRNVTVGLAVFARGRYAKEYLELFLRSANKHFMPGHRVVFYILTGSYFRPPSTERPLCSFQLLLLDEMNWWVDTDFLHMKALAEHIGGHILEEADFLFSMTANLVFQHDFGVETLGTSVAQLHAWWYFRKTWNLPYERKPQSAAYIPFGQGDFFYGSSIIGGTPQNVLELINEYLRGVVHDLERGLNSTFERHLNKFFFLNKPTKLLSPEYSWDSKFRVPPQVHYIKVSLNPERE